MYNAYVVASRNLTVLPADEHEPIYNIGPQRRATTHGMLYDVSAHGVFFYLLRKASK
jgi:hypothetical protein